MTEKSNASADKVGLRLTRPELVSLLYGVLGTLVVFALDILTGNEISFSIFYLLPVAFVAWKARRNPALWIAVLSGICWYVADIRDGNRYSHPAIPVWNALMRTLIFLAVGMILSKLRASVIREQEARAIATDATRAKSDFLSNMSHEIRTPLNAMIGAADILSETELSEEQAEYLEIFKIEGEQSRRLLNDILDYSKIEAHRLQLEHTAFGLRKLVCSACQSLEPRCVEKGLDLRWTVAPELKDIRVGDPYRLRQILTNLLNNAVKFTKKGGVSVRVEGTPATITFFVEDTGVGIPSDQQSNIFGRFSQSDVSITRRYGGSGLGLSIAKGLVEQMGGQIGFESVVGQGTIFIFDAALPEADEEAAAEFSRPSDRGAVDALPVPTRILNVLLVDDYEFNRRIIGHFLESPFIKLELAKNGKEGLEKIVAHDFDLVLLDMHMPEMDGWTVARAVRQQEGVSRRTSPLPIIALTASALKEDEERCLAAGCTSFLGKPIRKQDLLKEIERVLKVNLWRPEKKAGDEGEPEIDPEIAKLVPGFLDEVVERCELLLQAAGGRNLATAPEITHQLIGLGGTYGFDRVSDLARQIETVALRNEPAKVARFAGELKAYVYGLKKAYE